MKVLLKLLIPGALFIGLTTTVSAALPDGAAGPWADVVESSTQGNKKNGDAVNVDRSDPSDALGVAESTGTDYDNPVVAGSFFSLGFGGEIVLSFTNYIVNEIGNDLQIYEVTGGSSYPDEKIKVEASQDGITWELLEAEAVRDQEIDLGILPWAKYVRITDVSDPAIFESTADGFDLDGVLALHSAEEVYLGCTLTQGYWKNHEEDWPTDNLDLGDKNYTQEELLDILKTPVKGDDMFILAHQLIAAKLNILDGADPTEVSSEIADADTILTGIDLTLGTVKKRKDSDANQIAGILDSFNNGLIGPGHCDDEDEGGIPQI